MRKILILFTVAFLVLLGSCKDFLSVRPVGAVDESNFVGTKDGINLALAGMYASLYTSYNVESPDYFSPTISDWVYGDVIGGDANKGSTFNDQSDFTNLETYVITTDNSYLNIKWISVYNGVFRANEVLSLIEKSKEKLSGEQGESKDFYTEAVAQARFLRGFWHFEGIKLFGAAIPYVGDEEFASSVNPIVSNVDESGNYIYIWDKVISDLRYAYENLPEVWSTDKGRTNKWAAAALLAKVEMYQSSPYNGTNNTVNRWKDVRNLLDTIITSGRDNHGTKFRLADTYQSLFTAGESDWTGESVFDVQMAVSGSETYTNVINGPSNIAVPGGLGVGGWGFYQPSNEFVNSHITNAEGLPYLDKSYQHSDALTTFKNGKPETDLTVFTDPRLDISVGRFDVPYLDWSIPTTADGWIRDISNGGLYLNKKNTPRKSDKGSLSVTTAAGSSAKNFHLIRFADVLLMYAESLIETGDYEEARTYVNEVRARAANSFVKAADPTTMQETTSPYVLEDKVHNTVAHNTAANYRIGLYPESQFSTKEGALKALRFERKLEFGMEGKRWFDLTRWGIAADELNSYVGFEKTFLSKFSSSVYNPKWVTFPIPHQQIITMEGALVQNENWK